MLALPWIDLSMVELDLLSLIAWFALLFIITITCFSFICFALLTLPARFAWLGCLFHFACFTLICLLALVDLLAYLLALLYLAIKCLGWTFLG